MSRRHPDIGIDRMIRLKARVIRLSDHDIRALALTCAREVMDRLVLGENASIALSSNKHPAVTAVFGRGLEAAKLKALVDAAIKAKDNGP
jgi:hypothetical protein